MISVEKNHRFTRDSADFSLFLPTLIPGCQFPGHCDFWLPYKSKKFIA